MSLKSASINQRRQMIGTSASKLVNHIGILLLIVILSTRFSIEEIGLYFFLFAGVNLLSNIAGGLGEAVRKRVSAKEGKQSSYLTTALLSTFGLQILISVSLWVSGVLIPTEYLPDIIRDISGPLLIGSLAFLFSQSTAKIMINYNSGLGYPSRSEWLGKALPGILFFVLSVSIILLNFGLAYVFCVGAFSYGLSALLMFLSTRPNLYSSVSYHKLISLLEFGKWSIPNKIIMDFYRGLDVLILGVLVTSTAVSFYESSQNLAHLVFSVPYGLSAVLAVKVSGLDAQNKRHSIKRILGRDLPLSVSIPIGFFFMVIIFGEPILGFIYGSEFIGAYLFLVLLAVKEVLLSYRVPIQSLNYGLDKPQIPLYSNIISVSFNIVTVVPLVWILGGPGVIVSTVLAEVIRSVVISYLSKEYIRQVDFKRLLIPFVIGFLIFCVFWISKGYFELSSEESLLSSVVFLVVYIATHYGTNRLYTYLTSGNEEADE